MMVRITAPDGQMLRDSRTDTLHSDVVCDERRARYFAPVEPPKVELVKVALGKGIDVGEAVKRVAKVTK